MCAHTDTNIHKVWHTTKFNDQFEILYDIKYIIHGYLKEQWDDINITQLYQLHVEVDLTCSTNMFFQQVYS